MNNFSDILTKEELINISKEFLRTSGQTYLDHAGATLYTKSQIECVSKDLTENLYLNPHTSKLTSDTVDQIRFQVLNHFNTDHNEYSIIFTSGSTASLKLVAESFEYSSSTKSNEDDQSLQSGAFVYLQDNHTSVLGMREVAKSKSATVICVPHNDMLNCLSLFGNKDEITNYSRESTLSERALFVYPAECNFSGYKYPLQWIECIRDGAFDSYIQNKAGKMYSWIVMLDTAAFASTNRLDLSMFKPDFTCISFYKIFGFPTGLGALLVKKSSAHLLNGKTYYGGGTVNIAMSGVDFHIKRESLHERFEDGTISFLSILAIKHGFDTLNKLIPKRVNGNIMDTISLHTFILAKSLYERLTSLSHFNKKPVICIYADSFYNDITKQGGIVNFNLLRSNGDYIGFAEVIHMAQLFNIHLRSGCFCNPGACQRFLKLSNDDLLKHHKAGHICGDNHDLVDGTPTGSLRASFGYMSTMEDVDSIINMIVKCFVENTPKLLSITKFEHPKNNYFKNGNNEIIGILHEIQIYPIKSCAPFKIHSKWNISAKGLKYDREWMIVTESGVALSQKQDTRICLIKPIVDLDKNVLELSFPDVDSITIPLEINSNDITEKSMCNSKVCNDIIKGFDCGNEVADWLLDILGIPGLRLIKQSDNDIRTFKKKKDVNSSDKPIALANQGQYLAINLASVRWLSSKIESQEFDDKIDNLTARFRGNLIIETEKQFDELSWKNVQIGDIEFQVDGSCTRCQMVCIDQESGQKTVEPLRTISKQFDGKINFGIYLSHKNVAEANGENKWLSCGDYVHLL